jgi:TRAP-type C4-dicarboxylate transport system permease small subunit
MKLSPAAFHCGTIYPCRRKEFTLKDFWKKVWNELEVYFMVVFMAGFLLTVLWGIISREFFNAPSPWTEEMARILFIWMVFLGFSYSTLHGTHIRIDFVVNKLFKGISGEILNILIYLLALVIFTWLFVNGIEYIAYCATVRTPAMQIPRSWLVTILPVTGFLMMVRLTYMIVCSARNIVNRKNGKEAKV